MKQPRQAFTLIELLVVISIIVLLIAILLPALKSAREAGQTTQNLSNLRQVTLGLHLYAHDNNAVLPYRNGAGPHWGGKLIGMGYLSDPMIYWSPLRNTQWIGTLSFDTLEDMRTNPSSTTYQFTGYAVNARLMADANDSNPLLRQSYRLNTRFELHSGTVNRRPHPSGILLITEAFMDYLYADASRVDGWYYAQHSHDNITPFTTRGASVQAYLDGHVVSVDSQKSIQWTALSDRTGTWYPASHNHWKRQEPWYSLK